MTPIGFRLRGVKLMASECRIRILDDDVAGKIAAGEVVERPASVVKELIENAVDAGATRITVEVEDGGKQLIRITDNGCGMTAQEAVLSLQRHATSKITRAEDLASVRTLGFRGEALPSVASVSRLTLVTSARGETEGVRLEADAGQIREMEAAGAVEGTIVTIRELFFNTPARLKFLKATRTELGQICDVLTRLALSQPGIRLRLVADGEEVLNAPGSPDPLNTVATLYGNDLARELVSVSYNRPGLAVEGYVSKPTVTRPTRSAQHLFVNGRWVRNRTLTHALDEAYRATVPGGRFPFAALHVEIDPALVDVNVHPAKAEVRFLKDWEVHRAVNEAVREALGTPNGAPQTLARQHTLRPEDLHGGSWLPPSGDAGQPAAPADPFAGPDPGALPPSAIPAASQLPIPDLGAPLRGLRPIAQLWESYILAEGPAGLVIVDQHLAHERVLFDKIRRAGDEGTPVIRRLASPVTLQLTHREALAADEVLPDLGRAGFELEPFGRDAFVIRAVPELVPADGEIGTLRLVLAQVLERQGIDSAQRPALPDSVAAAAACKAAVKKGARLGAEEIARLLEDLAGSEQAQTCPHGCPIAVEISFHELLRRFKRI